MKKDKKFLKEMVKSILNEEQMLGLSFQTPIMSDTSFYGLNSYFNLPSDIDIYTNDSQLMIEWDLDVDANERGIKDMKPLVKKVRGYFNWEIVKDGLSTEEIQKLSSIEGSSDTRDSIVGSVDFLYEYTQNDWNIIIENSINQSDSGSISFYPGSLEIDFEKNTITMEF